MKRNIPRNKKAGELSLLKGKSQNPLEKFSAWITRKTGTSSAFVIALTVVVVWVISGPLFDYSDTWQLVINTATTVLTFLMIFLVQRSQNKDSLSIQLKLNELIASSQLASNRLILIEDLTEEELQTLENFYRKLASMSKKDKDFNISHTVEEALALHKMKKKTRKEIS
jgi:low affinity Fe/Cu permease